MSKAFDDAAAYDRSIRDLVPGYDVLRDVAMVGFAGLPAQGTMLVVGAGTGEELVELAGLLPGWRIEGLEPSEAMALAARRRVRGASCSERVRVRQAALVDYAGPPCQAALCLLVEHFVPDDGQRLGFWRDLAAALQPGAPLMMGTIEQMPLDVRRSWVAWAARRGLDDASLARLDERLAGGFELVSAERGHELATRAGFTLVGERLTVFGLALRCWRRGSHQPSPATGSGHRSSASSR